MTLSCDIKGAYPCPFCGNYPEFRMYKDKCDSISHIRILHYCRHVDFDTYIEGDDPAELIVDWNTRHKEDTT